MSPAFSKKSEGTYVALSFPCFHNAWFRPLIIDTMSLCVRNSSYMFMPIFLKVYICFCRGQKMCIGFAYNPDSIYLSQFTWFTPILSKCIDSGYLVRAISTARLCQFFKSFPDVRFACAFDIIAVWSEFLLVAFCIDTLGLITDIDSQAPIFSFWKHAYSNI